MGRCITLVMPHWQAFQIPYLGSYSQTRRGLQMTCPGISGDAILLTEMGFCFDMCWITSETSKLSSLTTSQREEGWKEKQNTSSCQNFRNFCLQRSQNSFQMTRITVISTMRLKGVTRGFTPLIPWTGGMATSRLRSGALAPREAEKVTVIPRPKSYQESSSAAGSA